MQSLRRDGCLGCSDLHDPTRDSLADVAQRTYGDRSLYRMLADYNGIADPDLILIGQIIRIPANPCAAQKVAAAANPCNPCSPRAAANPCNPCNPCAAQSTAGASDCVVPRLQTAAAQNPCAATKTTNPCNPCTAANPCNPCAATNRCAAKNPCAAANPCNPCNPCAPAEAVELTPEEASAAYECIKGAMEAAYTGQLRQAAAAKPCNPCVANPCNPCAATNPCNPCAATKATSFCNPCAATKIVNPCNPCAATKPANPCNPCAAKNPCNPCAAPNPCKPGAANSPCNPGAVQAAAVPDEVAEVARSYQAWTQVNTAPYVSATHGSRYVNNYPGPEAAEAYRKFEEIGAMPAGGRIAEDSFTVAPDGRVAVGPLFIMEKMAEGFNEGSGDWRYAMIMPDGSLFGVTNGPGSQKVQFCAECHAIVADDQDSLYFMPEEFRLTSG